ncbi:hypothetical protein Pmani_010116 [Petrolisthes manimaculis]|uniref:Uncharacterized protein n=1 Tax=Petrolisthes manimaculis TaxID=1843537 RepID=A0AAE1UC92_9EUCA|nr:hypothetical protein Pmani_010116 [Petrolisthes manimaculis]
MVKEAESSGRRPPWPAALAIMALVGLGGLTWRHLTLEWRVERLEAQLEAGLQTRIELALKAKLEESRVDMKPQQLSTVHTRVQRDLRDSCVCPQGMYVFTLQSTFRQTVIQVHYNFIHHSHVNLSPVRDTRLNC